MNEDPQVWRERFVHELANSMKPLYVILRVVNRHNPIGILWDVNPHEYEVEAERILSRMSEARGPEDVTTIVHEMFVRAFDLRTTGSKREYIALGRDLWNAWTEAGFDRDGGPGEMQV